MGRKIDLLGQRFNRLIVLEEAGRNKQGKVLWKCLCDCGKVKNVNRNFHHRYSRGNNTIKQFEEFLYI